MPKNRTGVRGSQEPRAEAVGDAPDTAFSQNEFEGYFNQYNLEVSAERKKLYEETWAKNSEIIKSLQSKQMEAQALFDSLAEPRPIPTNRALAEALQALPSTRDDSDSQDGCSSPAPHGPAAPSQSSDTKPITEVKDTCERGNKHLALQWGKPPPPTRKFATFKIGESKESIPVIRIRRPTSVRPCYRSWTTLQKNVYVEDDLVLRAIPYFGDNDNGRLDYLERGYERILDDTAYSHVDPYLSGMAQVRKVIFRMLSRFGIGEAVPNLVKLLNQVLLLRRRVRLQADWAEMIQAEIAQAANHQRTCSNGGTTGSSDVSLEGVNGAEVGKKRKHNASSKESSSSRSREEGHFEWHREKVMSEYEAARKEADNQDEGGAKQGGMDSYRTLFCRRCYKYDCSAHGTWQPQPGLRPSPIVNHPDLEIPSGPPNGSEGMDRFSLEIPATGTGYVPESGLSEREWRMFSSAVRICGNDYKAIATLCCSQGEPRLTEERIRDIMMNTRLLSSMAQRARNYSSAGRRKENMIQVAAKETQDGCEAELASVWICPCRMFCGNGASNDAPLSMERRRKLQRSRMNSLTYRRWVKRDKDDGLQPEYSPCDCASKGLFCAEGTCSCIDNGHFCDKFCGCPNAECLNRFPGCQCRSDKRRCRTSSCPCYAAYRECDPDTCMCGAAAQISDLSQQPSVSADPTQHRSDGSFPPPCASGAVEHSEGETEGVQKEEKDGHDSKGGGASGAACGNLRILTRRHATLRMGVSEVSGWGVFSTRGLERDEFVYEYMGEVVSHDEADRRGSIYDKFNHSFLFNLNSATVVDAARKGNKTRFANHSSKANCYTRIMLVHGEHRIGVYAKDAIAPGDELFYDYRHEHAKYQGISAVPDWLRR